MTISQKAYRDFLKAKYWASPVIPGGGLELSEAEKKENKGGGGVNGFLRSSDWESIPGGGEGTGAMSGEGLIGQLNPDAYIPSQLDFTNNLLSLMDPTSFNPFGIIGKAKSVYDMITKIDTINMLHDLQQASNMGLTPPGAPDPSTAFGGIFGGAIGPLGGGLEGYGPNGPGPAGSLGDDGYGLY
jgi:hypothetical protein